VSAKLMPSFTEWTTLSQPRLDPNLVRVSVVALVIKVSQRIVLQMDMAKLRHSGCDVICRSRSPKVLCGTSAHSMISRAPPAPMTIASPSKLGLLVV
jgi:hypothetical protein